MRIEFEVRRTRFTKPAAVDGACEKTVKKWRGRAMDDGLAFSDPLAVSILVHPLLSRVIAKCRPNFAVAETLFDVVL
ncbi:hypothetical protein LOC70_16855 [Rhodopirellula sp. JC737]|nr:hypothetical protein [Rhodopirellula sp. JC737]